MNIQAIISNMSGWEIAGMLPGLLVILGFFVYCWVDSVKKHPGVMVPILASVATFHVIWWTTKIFGG